MGEAGRIFRQKKYILCVITFLVANVLLFQYYQMDTLHILQESKSREILLEEWQQEREDAKQAFDEKMEQMSGAAQSLLGISIFSDQKSFSYKNIIKTQEDFQALQAVEIEIVNDKAVMAFLEYGEGYLAGFLIVLVTVLAFFDERKSGLWQLVYTCRNGRLSLAAKRLLILFVVSLIGNMFLMGSTLAVSFSDYGGWEIFRCSAQSVTALQDFTVPVSVGTFLLYYLIVSTAALFVEGAFVWGMLSVIHNRNLGMIVTAVIYGVEYFLYQVLSAQNPVCILRYLNLYFWLSPKEIFTEYINFPLGNMLLNEREFTQACLVIFSVAACVWVLAAGTRTHPVYVPGVVERKTERFLCNCRKLLCRMNGMGYEMYKFLVQGKGIVVFAIFAYIIISGVAREEILLSPGRELLNDFYAENTGEIDDGTMTAYDAIRTELESVSGELEAAAARRDEEFGESAFKEALDKYESYEATRSMFRELKRQRSYGKKLEQRGIRGWFLNERGFRKLLGDDHTVKRLLRGVLAVVALVLMLSPAFSSERRAGVQNMIRCTKKGRGRVFARKCICAGCFILLVAGILFGSEVYEIAANYSFDGLRAPVQNIRLLKRFPFSWSIAGFLVAWYGLRLLALMAVSLLCLGISSLTERVEKTYLFSFLLLPMAFLTGASEYMILGTGRMLKTTLVVIVLCMCSLVGFGLSYRVWVGGKRKDG